MEERRRGRRWNELYGTQIVPPWQCGTCNWRNPRGSISCERCNQPMAVGIDTILAPVPSGVGAWVVVLGSLALIGFAYAIVYFMR